MNDSIFSFVSICQNRFIVVVLWVEHLFVPVVTIYSEQDLNKLVSPFSYVNKFPMLLSNCKTKNQPFLKPDLHSILYFVCIFPERISHALKPRFMPQESVKISAI